MPAKPKQPTPIRTGQRVRIVVPEFVVRVGYPMTVDAEQAEVLAAYRRDIEDFLLRLGAAPDGRFGPRAVGQIARTVAVQRCHAKGWSGRTRSIHTQRIDRLKGCEFVVSGVRFVKTGEYVPATTWNGEYEPAYLADEMTHRLLELPFGPLYGEMPDNFANLEIEARHCEQVDCAGAVCETQEAT